MLADLGAEVIKVEHPAAGTKRAGGAALRGKRRQGWLVSFLAANRNKKSVTIDFARSAADSSSPTSSAMPTS